MGRSVTHHRYGSVYGAFRKLKRGLSRRTGAHKTGLRRTAVRRPGARGTLSGRIRRFAVRHSRFRGLSPAGIKAAAWILLLLLIIILWQLFNPRLRVTAADETVAALRVPYQAAGMLEAYAAKHGVPFAELFTLFCAENEFFPEKRVVYDLSGIEAQYVAAFDEIKRRYNNDNVKPYNLMFETLFNELSHFPIAEADGDEPSVMYGDSWGIERNYEGDKLHRGADILDRENIRGRVTVVSMTNGAVKDAGWDDELGYYVGVLTANGTYYLYAHLDSIDPSVTAGAGIRGGQDIGRMGDSGGNGESFPVHLHIGISPEAGFAGNDFWINPYPFLRYIEEPRLL